MRRQSRRKDPEDSIEELEKGVKSGGVEEWSRAGVKMERERRSKKQK